MVYKWEFTKAAQKDLASLDLVIARRIIKKLQWFARQPDPFRYGRRLVDSAIGDIRFRIGEYRVITLCDEKRHCIQIIAIGHRRDIYQ